MSDMELIDYLNVSDTELTILLNIIGVCVH